jgi:hypothetical protein
LFLFKCRMRASRRSSKAHHPDRPGQLRTCSASPRRRTYHAAPQDTPHRAAPASQSTFFAWRLISLQLPRRGRVCPPCICTPKDRHTHSRAERSIGKGCIAKSYGPPARARAGKTLRFWHLPSVLALAFTMV